MSKPAKLKNRFKARGADILAGHGSRPASMKAFVEDDYQEGECTQGTDEKGYAQKPKNTFTQNHIIPEPHKHTATGPAHERPAGALDHDDRALEPMERLHIQISKEIVDKLLGIVFARKRDSSTKRKNATQRAIIEEALEEYFARRGL